MEELGKFVAPKGPVFPASPSPGEVWYHTVYEELYRYGKGPEQGWTPVVPQAEVEATSQSAAGTGNLSWTHSFGVADGTVDRLQGLLVLIVANDSTPSDEVTKVTVHGVEMEEIPSSPFLHSLGTEDGVIYGYYLGGRALRQIVVGETGAPTITVTVSGATTKRAVAFSILADSELCVSATKTEEIESGTTLDPNIAADVVRPYCIGFAALHSGNDSVATLGTDGIVAYTHDFGTQVASWIYTGPDKIRANIEATQAASAAGMFLVNIGPVVAHGLVTSLPTVAGRGDTCRYIADSTNGIVWDLIYDGEGTYPWKKIGGPPLMARSDVARTLNNAAYTSLPTDPLSLTAPLKGDYDIRIEAELYNEASGRQPLLSCAVGAVAANDNWCIDFYSTSTAIGAASCSAVARHTEVAAAAKIEEKAKTAGGQCRFTRRRLIVDPIRVG